MSTASGPNSRDAVTSLAQQMAATSKIPDVQTKMGKNFSGDPSELISFLTRLASYFVTHKNEFPNDQARVLFASSCIDGDAYKWFTFYLEEFLFKPSNKRDEETNELMTDYGKFQAKLKKVFSPPERARTAVRKIKNLRQTGSATRYAAEFLQHANQTDWDEAPLVEAYHSGLKEHVKEIFHIRGQTFDDLETIMEQSKVVDSRNYERQLEKKGQDKGRSSYWPKPPRNDRQDRGDPMQLDATFPKGKLSNKEREHRMKSKLCLYCGNAGHQVKDCRKKKNQFNATKKPRGKRQQLGLTKFTSDSIRSKIEARLVMLDLPPVQDQHWHKYVQQLTNEQRQRFWDAAGTGQAASAARKMIEHAIYAGEQGEDWLQAPDGMEEANKILSGQMQQLYPDSQEKQEWLEAYNQTSSDQPKDHTSLSWTACYDDDCTIHLSDKEGSGWFPRKLKQQTSEKRGEQQQLALTRGRPKSPFPEPNSGSEDEVMDAEQDDDYNASQARQRAEDEEQNDSDDEPSPDAETTQETWQKPHTWEGMLWRLCQLAFHDGKLSADQDIDDIQAYIQLRLRRHVEHLCHVFELRSQYHYRLLTYYDPSQYKVTTPDGCIIQLKHTEQGRTIMHMTKDSSHPLFNFISQLNRTLVPLRVFLHQVEQKRLKDEAELSRGRILDANHSPNRTSYSV